MLRSIVQKAGQSLNTTRLITTRQFGSTTVKNEIFKVQSIEDFENKVKKSDKVVIVDFFATWCNPCKMLTPRIESIVGEKAGAINLAKVDIDEHSELALDYDVAAVPVLMAMKGGKVINRMVGLQDTDKLRAWIDKTVEENK
ncbi:thioredoxin, mitochondrial [Musca autumnalis]|uniref:thioredoxin, mitochondrial n=1 Tax=Musca autumnalis TaxID=221902 RepID=UPI003CF4DED0